MINSDLEAAALTAIDAALASGHEIPSIVDVIMRSLPSLRLNFKDPDSEIESRLKRIVLAAIGAARSVDEFVGAVMIGEAWMSQTKSPAMSGLIRNGVLRPVADPDRKEIILVATWTNTGRTFRQFEMDNSGSRRRRGPELPGPKNPNDTIHESWVDRAFE